MKWWPLFGLRKKWTEKKRYETKEEVASADSTLFRRSLFVYVIDVGSANGLNFELNALESPQYNPHRMGIYFTDSPRHADILLVLGRPPDGMIDPLQETISQLPRPFGIITIDDSPSQESGETHEKYPELPHHIAHIRGVPSAEEILAVLRSARTDRQPKTEGKAKEQKKEVSYD